MTDIQYSVRFIKIFYRTFLLSLEAGTFTFKFTYKYFRNNFETNFYSIPMNPSICFLGDVLKLVV